MIQEFARVLRAQLAEEIETAREHLARGRCKCFDEYTRLVGKIQGLELAEERIKSLAKKAETDDDDQS
jgi:hypothetical protein